MKTEWNFKILSYDVNIKKHAKVSKFKLHALHVLIMATVGMLASVVVQQSNNTAAWWVLGVSIALFAGALVKFNTNYQNIGQ